MARVAALALAVVPAVAAWAFARTDFGLVLACGAAAAAGGLWVCAARLPRAVRIAAAGFAFAALPGASALALHGLAGEMTPHSVYDEPCRDLAQLTLPLASMATCDLHTPPRTILSLDQFGQVHWRGKVLTLGEVETVLPELPKQPLLLRLDKDTPYAHLAWLLDIARRTGHERVLLAARRHLSARYSEEEGRALLGERDPSFWPECEFALPLAAPGPGSRVRVEGHRRQPRRWGPWHREVEVMAPTEFRFALGERTTRDLAELASWMRADPPAALEADPTVPVKYVVAVLNQLAKAGLPAPALLRVQPPTAEERAAPYLPFPAGP